MVIGSLLYKPVAQLDFGVLTQDVATLARAWRILQNATQSLALVTFHCLTPWLTS